MEARSIGRDKHASAAPELLKMEMTSTSNFTERGEKARASLYTAAGLDLRLLELIESHRCLPTSSDWRPMRIVCSFYNVAQLKQMRRSQAHENFTKVEVLGQKVAT